MGKTSGTTPLPGVGGRDLAEEDLTSIFRGLFKPAKPAATRSAGEPTNVQPAGAASITTPLPSPTDVAGKNLWLKDWNARFKAAVAPENPTFTHFARYTMKRSSSGAKPKLRVTKH